MKKIVIIGAVWPEPNSTAAGQRMMQLIAVFKQLNYKLTFTSIAATSEYTINLDELGIETNAIQLNDSSFDEFIKVQNPTIVLFDRFMTEEQFGWRVSENCPNALRILDSEDLHFLREARSQCFKLNIKCETKHLQNDIALREIASIYRCDLTLIISKFEHDLLVNTFNISSELVHYIPMMYDELNEIVLEDYPKFEEREHFFSIGNFHHKPNWETVLQLKNSIWPKIRKQLPQAELHIYGAYIPEKAKQLHNSKEGFIIKGRAENSAAVFKKYRTLLAPIPFGAGIKGKLLESMLYGTPNITSEIGAEAMQYNKDWNGFIEDNPDDFAEKAVELYSNENIWKQAQLNGISIINDCFNKNNFENEFMDTVHFLLSNIESHRTNNFMGQLLNHHTLKSTMYMSKWIEEKNKK
ncbi:glycosyltransferase [uncultured Flavobacterium sp.]|uniref:glycosyltransferase n=1 Tax=uncultured Flavobacterium sp. TaxID=165435 RepID=UPI0030EEBED9|tara:strand:+ start:53269 stop:54501 length:1233 start_codon:yes stop_codon:yes gene_type:complete